MTTDRAALGKALADARARRDKEGPTAARRVKQAVAAEQETLKRCQAETAAAARETIAARSAGLQLDARVAEAEHTLRVSADPRIATIRSALVAHWDAVRVGGARESALALMPKIKVAQAELEKLELAVDVDVDVELRRVLDAAGVTTRELEQASYPWR